MYARPRVIIIFLSSLSTSSANLSKIHFSLQVWDCDALAAGQFQNFLMKMSTPLSLHHQAVIISTSKLIKLSAVKMKSAFPTPSITVMIIFIPNMNILMFSHAFQTRNQFADVFLSTRRCMALQ